MRFTNYDKMHDELTKILMECTPPDLGGTWDTYGRGYAAGLHRALYELECQEKFTDWDDRQKLLQPERSDFDWSIVDAMVNGLSDMLPDTNKAHGDGWLQDWLKNFMWEYGIDPADLLMEEKPGDESR
ncbi:hypothetical protein [Porcincola intestinalis]|uniref:Uncharacterized protein n=1 Tax=Porcincola intestinalis TaxID=2606632 RepID=A0A6L5X2X7_9FIRM|nr:hypothetical protein [Porcincola intestinalis]MSS13668.1 hypothetical protein [Porcincola intestinalis]